MTCQAMDGALFLRVIILIAIVGTSVYVSAQKTHTRGRHSRATELFSDTGDDSDALATLLVTLHRDDDNSKLKEIKSDNEKNDVEWLIGSAPSLLTVGRSVAPSHVSDDGPMRKLLGDLGARGAKDAADVGAAIENSKRAAPRQFTDDDMVLDQSLRWSVPQHHPPVCISERDTAPPSSMIAQTALIGTLLDDATYTSIGSIMPRFRYTEDGH